MGHSGLLLPATEAQLEARDRADRQLVMDRKSFGAWKHLKANPGDRGAWEYLDAHHISRYISFWPLEHVTRTRDFDTPDTDDRRRCAPGICALMCNHIVSGAHSGGGGGGGDWPPSKKSEREMNIRVGTSASCRR